MVVLTEEGIISKHKSVSLHRGHWKGGRIRDGDGYWRIKLHGHPRANYQGYVCEHILVFEDAYKCCTLKWCDVHHKDDNKANNVWYNLSGMMHGQHKRLHWKGRQQTDEANRKNSEAHKGKNNPFYGKHLSDEHKRKLSEAGKRFGFASHFKSNRRKLSW